MQINNILKSKLDYHIILSSFFFTKYNLKYLRFSFFCSNSYYSSIKVFIDDSFKAFMFKSLPITATFLLNSSHLISTSFCFCFSLLFTKSHKILRSSSWYRMFLIFSLRRAGAPPTGFFTGRVFDLEPFLKWEGIS